MSWATSEMFSHLWSDHRPPQISSVQPLLPWPVPITVDALERLDSHWMERIE